MQNRKQKILTTAVATALAASLLIGGGTFAYLQDETNDVVNNFETNQVTVDLEETTGNDYNIIPGTEEDKDPKVTVNNTVDSYVYVEVTDATDGLVDYTIAEGWTLLDGYDNVYYREIAVDAEVKEFYVLDGNKVTYDASLTNTDMVDAEGNLKEGLALTFKAYAIQKEPFADAVAAWEGKETQFVEDEESLKAALEAGGDVVVNADVALDYTNVTGPADGSSPMMVITADTTLDLQGTVAPNTATTTASLPTTPVVMSIESGTTVIDGDGTISAEAGTNNSYGINVNGGNLVINGGNYYGAMTAVQVQKGSLTINGGFFDLAPTIKSLAPSFSKYLVNCIDDAYKDGSATVTITGGTFVNFDPSVSPEDVGTSYVADGYTVVSETQGNGDVWYTVVPA